MVSKKITSLQHPRVLEWVRLRSEKSYRQEVQRLLISGKKMVREVEVETLITTDPNSDIFAKETILVTEPILKKITNVQQPDGFAAVTFLPKPQDLSQKRFLVILDQISDPGNLGTIMRCALALNWEGIIVTPNTVDLFNDKVLRAAKGAHFHLPYAYLNPQEISKIQLHFYTADTKGALLDEVQFQTPRALILSHESHGPSSWAHFEKITIPMSTKVESLNVAVSGAILLYAMRPK